MISLYTLNNRQRLKYISLTAAFLAIIGFFCSFMLIQQDSTSAADARQFNASNIMSDTVMTNKNSMTEAQIQSFLSSKNSCNNTNIALAAQYPQYSYNIKDGRFVCLANETFDGETAARIIWQAGQDYNINPQVLIVLLQKEQGLITDTWPNSTQYRSATGYGCPDTADCDAQYYGFKNQVRNAANFFRAYQTGNTGWYKLVWPGNKYTGVWEPFTYDVRLHPNASCGSISTVIENRATASLYSYTPYRPNQAALNAQYGTGDSCSSYGNRNFYLYFTDWFGSTYSAKDRQPLTSKKTNTLTPGEKLSPGQFLTSPNGLFTGIMQYSGQFITYKSQKSTWQTGTVDWSYEGAYLSFNSDGNLVLYKDSAMLWQSNTANMGASRFVLQNDGNLVIYTASNAVLWTSATSQAFTSMTLLGSSLTANTRMNLNTYLRSSDWRYFLVMQSDGNLVLYTAGRTNALWSSNTVGKGGKYTVLQTDGNLVMYGDKGAVWASETDGSAKDIHRLSLQTDGNLVMYDSRSTAQWSSNTVGKGGKYTVLQTDGNLVMYGDKGAVWATYSMSEGDKYARMQTDGNFVIYSSTNGALWNSTTFESGSSKPFNCTYTTTLNQRSRLNHRESLCSSDGLHRLVMQTDGNLVLYTKKTQVLWATYTNGQFFKSNLAL